LDWCSDEVSDFVAEKLTQAGMRATWFATHRSAGVEELLTNDSFEVGVHPNFLPGSTHGASEENVLRHITELLPEARCMRTHGLYQSFPMLASAYSDFAMHVDVSLFLPYHTNLHPTNLPVGGGSLLRLPYYWEDDAEMLLHDPVWSFREVRHAGPGLRIYDFHPVHVALNISDFGDYERLRAAHPPSRWDRAFIRKHQRKGRGTLSFFEEMLEDVQGGKTMSQLAQRVRWNQDDRDQRLNTVAV